MGSAKMRKSLANFAWNADPSSNVRPVDTDLEQRNVGAMTDCWPKANDPSHCGNDNDAYTYRFFPDSYDATENVTPYGDEVSMFNRCKFWEGLDRYEDF